MTNSLQNLKEQLDDQLTLLGLPAKNFLPKYSHQNQNIYDVAIIGAGMAGLTTAASLIFKGINNIAIFDAAPTNREGPWVNFARMNTLRSPKHLTGPALGIPALSFQAWYRVLYGIQAWQTLDRIPRQIWHDYLQWYKQVLGLNVVNLHKLTDINWTQTNELNHPIAALKFNNLLDKNIYARHVVLATGMDGFGGPNIPNWVTQIPQKYWQHSTEKIDMTQLKGKRIAIIGGRDSALDAAATALENGTKSVALCVRANKFSQINYFKATAGYSHWLAYEYLNQQQRSELLGFLCDKPTPPAKGTIERLKALNGLEIHLGFNVQKANVSSENNIELLSKDNLINADFLILATGYTSNPALRPELKNLSTQIRYYQPNEMGIGLPTAESSIPYLNDDFSFVEKAHGINPILKRIHCFNHAAMYSLGKISSDIPGISFGANKLTDGIVAKLFTASFTKQLNAAQDFSEQEITDKDLAYLDSKSVRDNRNRQLSYDIK